MASALNISATDRCKIASIIIDTEDFAKALRIIGEYFSQNGDIVYGILFMHMAININMYAMYCRNIVPHTENSTKYVTFEIPQQ